ncbi:MAG: hypothetical protein ACOCUS_04480 [Polyangiales bacterium]
MGRALFSSSVALLLAVLLSVPSSAFAQRGRGGVLALSIDGEDAALVGAEGGGEERTSGGRLRALPVTVQGGAEEMSDLVATLIDGRRFDGEIVQSGRRERSALLALDNARVTKLTVPALGGRLGELVLALEITPDDADVGPFESETAEQPRRGRARAAAVFSRMRRAVRRLAPARAELSIEGLGEVRPDAVGEVTVSRNSGGRLTASALEVTLDRDEADDWIEAFEGGRRFGDTVLRYVDRGGDELLKVSGDNAKITAARPNFESGGVTLRIELDGPSAAVPSE